MFGCTLQASFRIFKCHPGIKLGGIVKRHQSKTLDEMGHVNFLSDELGLDEMGLDKMALNPDCTCLILN